MRVRSLAVPCSMRPVAFAMARRLSPCLCCLELACLCNQSGPGIIEEGMTIPSNWPRNRLLLALPAGNLKRLMSVLEPIPCQEGQILLDADSSLDDVFFPDSGVVSVVGVARGTGTVVRSTAKGVGCVVTLGTRC